MAEFNAINFHSLINQMTKGEEEFLSSPSSITLQLKLAEFSSMAKALMSKGHLELMQKLDSKELETFIEILVQTNFGARTHVTIEESPALNSLEALRIIQIDKEKKLSLTH